MSQPAGNPYAAELAAAKKAVALAARLCQTVQQDIVQSDVQSKADRTPVTVADYGSQVLVSFVLNMEAPPSDSFSLVAEEDSEELRKDGAEEILGHITNLVNETILEDGSYSISFSKEGILSAIDSGKSEGGPSGRHWVLDPIDGTKGFLRGDQYAIALALLDEGKVVLGVLACPNLPLTSISNLNGSSSGDQVGALFSAVIGCGAEVQSLDGSPPQKISVCSVDNPVNASFFESYEGAHSMHDLTSSIAEKLGVQAPPVRIDSQAKYGALARGDGAIYLRFPHKGYREKIWDHAAGSIVVTGSQVLVSLVLKMELPSDSFSMVAEEDSKDLRNDGTQEMLGHIAKLVNETIVNDGSYNISLSKEDVLSAIDSGKSEGGPSGRHWILDPIDGTKGPLISGYSCDSPPGDLAPCGGQVFPGFAPPAGRPEQRSFIRGDQYAIALALLDEGKVVLGVLACPNLPSKSINNHNAGSSGDQVGALFSATIGCGAEVEALEGSQPQKISVCSINNPNDASFFESYERSHSMRDCTHSIAEKLGVQAPPVRIDSQAKYGALARGDGAIYLRFPHKGYVEPVWDHAAGSIIVTEAGGVVKDASGNDLDFTKGRYLDRDTGIIATNKSLMPLVLKAAQEAMEEEY